MDIPVIWKGKGRWPTAAQATAFEILLPGKRKKSRIEIPAKYLKSIKLKKYFVAEILVLHSKLQAEAASKRAAQRIQAAIRAKKKKPTQALKKQRKKLKEKQKEALIEEELMEDRDEKLPPFTPPIDKIVSVSTQKTKYVMGRNVEERQKRDDSFVGTNKYNGKFFEVEKLNVDFDKNKPVEIFQDHAKVAAVSLREYFRPYAEKFLDEQRGKSEEAFIMRVKTANRISGEKPSREGIGTARFQVRRTISKEQLKHYKKQYPGMSKDEILREIQLGNLSRELEQLFDYFVERYETYLGKRIIESMAVTGFSMEVVKEIYT